MSDELLLFELLECDNEDASTQRQRKLQRRRLLREHSDPFYDFDDEEFIKRYRLSKELVVSLCEELRPSFRKATKSTDLSIEQKVLTALSFYATGSYQRPTGDISTHSMAQQTVSSVLAEVTKCIDSPDMRRKYIHFPQNLEERNKVRARFYQKFKVPGVLGCIDCTHIALIRPTDNEERYYCRKNYHSLNVQLICDADMQIISVDASYGGATHDAFIWNVNPLKCHMESLNESTWFFGDSGYPQRRYMMTPVLNAAPGTPDSHYTELHIRTRNVIERTIGLLKARFRCLLAHRVLHYKPAMAASITNACVILHNICNKANIPVPDLSNEEVLQEGQHQTNVVEVGEGGSASNPNLQEGVALRRNLIQRLWDER